MPDPDFLHLHLDENLVTCVDADGRWGLEPASYAPPAPDMGVARIAGAKALVIVELPVGWQGGWHPSPARQWVICLAGEMGYEAGDGTEFILRPGGCILTTDTLGRGHNSWNAGQTPVRLALIQIENPS